MRRNRFLSIHQGEQFATALGGSRNLQLHVLVGGLDRPNLPFS